ncbi:MAG: CRISPR-associated helicase Cas3' [Conexivisphaera sp.]
MSGERPFMREALEALGERRLLVTAPTGYGKTSVTLEAARRTCTGDGWFKLAVAYPTRALIGEQSRVLRAGLQPGCAEMVGVRHMGVRESPFLVCPVTLTTLDTLALTSVGLSPEDVLSSTGGSSQGHFMFSRASVELSDVVLDEAHLVYDSQKSLAFLSYLMKLIEHSGSRLMLLSATMPRTFRDYLRRTSPGLRVEEFSCDRDRAFCEERRSKRYRVERQSFRDRDSAASGILEFMRGRKFRRALVVFNTVREAADFYRRLEAPRKVLLHSMFTEEDKARRIAEALSMDEGVLVGTQSVEVGINYSADLIVTEAAPLNSLVQRFGRFLRRGETEGSALVWWIEGELPGDRYDGIYDGSLVRRTLEVLDDDVNLHVEYGDLLDRVYREEPALSDDLYSRYLRIMADIKSVRPAVDELLKNMGSFVRDESMVTAVTSDGVELAVDLGFALRHLAKVRCGEERRNPPKNVFEAVRYSAAGCTFVLRPSVTYDPEVGLHEAG